VNTAITPSTAIASAMSMCLIRPFAMVAETTKPCAKPGTLYSAAYLAAPVTLARPSTREIGFPKRVAVVPVAIIRQLR
jgi:hypothetical protein